MLFVLLCALILFNSQPSASDCVSRQEDDCSSGFMSLDRIEAVVQGETNSEDHVLGDLTSYPYYTDQSIDPNINFTCNGSILSWTFAAQRSGDSQVHTELQIWRNSGNGSYTKVGSTTIMLEEESSPQIYQYTLTSPLPFQVGDILGWFQHRRSAHLQYENVGPGHLIRYVIQRRPSNQFTIGNSQPWDGVHILVNVETDPAGCGCGFMSVERMRIVLGLEAVGDRAFSINSHQQITPYINFTCDGLVTKWIIGAYWKNQGSSYPELQVWRNIGNDSYYKISGTIINIAARSPTHIYSYDTFSPIPVLAGDILGVFQPQVNKTKLTLWSEMSNDPLTYDLTIDNSTTESSFDIIYLQNMSSLGYHPLVTVEFFPRPSLFSLGLSSLPPEPVVTPPVSVTQSITTMVASTSLPPHTTAGDHKFFVGVGVAGLLLVLITAAVIIITVLVCLRKKTNKMNITDNVAYQSSAYGLNMSLNAAYTATSDLKPTSHDQEHVYMTTDRTISQQSNAKTTNTLTDEVSCIPTSTNVAYDIPMSANVTYGLPSSTNWEYEIAASTNQAYVASDIPTTTNQAYEAIQRQNGSDVLYYDYAILH